MKLMSFAIIERDNHYLLIRESSSKWKGKWFFPGGHVTSGEDPVSSVIRETKEETQRNALIDGIFYFKLERKILIDKMHIYYHGRINETVDVTKQKCFKNSQWFKYEEISNLPLRENALFILDIHRALTVSLPIYNFNFTRQPTPYQIKNFNPF
jgi:ADP-ribose pyrophosphatase YjhB (NUDIX family)